MIIKAGRRQRLQELEKRQAAGTDSDLLKAIMSMSDEEIESELKRYDMIEAAIDSTYTGNNGIQETTL